MKSITINALKFDGKLHRTWRAELLERQGDLLIFVGEFDRKIQHDQLGVIRRGTISYEYYWLDRWYNVFRFHEPDGALRNFYCNINFPPVFRDDVLSYVDFDIDILAARDLSYRILDLDEFRENSARYKYPDSVVQKCLETVEEVENLIKARRFPFDYIET